jgi:hypothetical protein
VESAQAERAEMDIPFAAVDLHEPMDSSPQAGPPDE